MVLRLVGMELSRETVNILCWSLARWMWELTELKAQPFAFLPLWFFIATSNVQIPFLCSLSGGYTHLGNFLFGVSVVVVFLFFFYHSSVFNVTFNAVSSSGTPAASLEQQTSRESDFCPVDNDSHHSTCTLYGLCLHPGSMSGLQGGAATHRKRRSLDQAQQTQCRGPVARKQQPYIMPKAICQPECLI